MGMFGNKPVHLLCEGCGESAPPMRLAAYPFRCPRAGTDARDHVLAPTLNVPVSEWPTSDNPNPFYTFRRLLHAHVAALDLGMGDVGYCDVLDALDNAVEQVDGRAFRTTPLESYPTLANAARVGQLWVKNETGNVSGSHKGRHLFGVLLHLELVKHAGGEPRPQRVLAIASCGNAALAAATLARAAQRQLAVMVPPDAHPHVLERLKELGATIHICHREPGQLGDPTFAAFLKAVGAGAVPFACQGTECGLTLDGGKTLAYEIVTQESTFDRVFVQVGGGALASSLTRGFNDARALGVLPQMPRIMAVQTESVAPLAAAYTTLVDLVRAQLPDHAFPTRAGDELADALRSPSVQLATQSALYQMASDRRRFFPPWPTPKSSAAHGILDDETYDIVAILKALVESGGSPVVCPEQHVLQAQSLGQSHTGIQVDATGTSGLAGLLTWGQVAPPLSSEKVLVLFTGAQR
ncbi:MAG: pyridoxal-phosphate dependent enzyme [Polyangiaceae bacterium]|nr:pyridoxal-phosphate dependent enzyme [Polyangiaceae bacterium]